MRTVLAAVKQVGSTDTDQVAAAMAGMKYDFYKGPQQYRACDHQSVQSVFVLESKSKDMLNASDVFNIVATVPASEDMLVSCAMEGHV